MEEAKAIINAVQNNFGTAINEAKSNPLTAVGENADEVENKNVLTNPKAIGGTFVDEEAMLAKSTFAIKPDDLVELTKKVLSAGIGTEDPDMLADDFEFCAPVVGPL